ncbi:hypothetical protein [Umezawaea sp. NPDC059074]|uniref:hypothetical protein n=1 Tax=Umezawaea sp. NPDC059074 TaxID=3346716 RepID=UPI0036820342
MSARSTIAAGLALLLVGAFTGVASAVPAKEPDLKVTVAYEKAEYPPGADLAATVTVENVGTVAAEGVKVTFSGNYVPSDKTTAAFADLKRIEPEGKVSAVVVGKPANGNEVVGTLVVQAVADGVVDPTPDDNRATATTKIVNPVGAVTGTVYVDADHNGKRGESEGKAGIEVRGVGALTAVTDGKGQFSFRNVPSGKYRLAFGGTDGFLVKPGSSEFTVKSGEVTDLDLAAVRPVTESLTAKVEFDKASYAKADQVGVTVTLANKGADPLPGVVAVCRSDAGHLIPGTGPGWAALAPGGTGVAVAAGETKTVKVTDVVPDGAYNNGGVAVACEFGNDGTNVTGYAKADGSAKVVGAVGDLKGDLKNDGKAVASATLVALDTTTRAVLGRATTDSAGAWSLTGLPAGTVNVVVLGPWKDAQTGGIDHLVHVTGGAETAASLTVVAGAEVPDPNTAPKLRASVEFTADSFESDASLKVTLTNQSGAPLTVIARCIGDLPNDTDAWGALKVDGPGVDLAVDETKTVDVTATIPQTAKDRGYVTVECALGPKIGTSFLTATDTAKVTGVVAGASGSLLKPDGTTVADTKIVLVDPDTADPIARATTDADGKFTFTDVPTGRYRPVVVGPWKVVDEDLYEIVHGTDTKRDIHVEPGPDVTDPDTTTPPETTTEPPAEGGGDETPPADDLAYTGASVIGITLLGVLVLALGAGAILLGRRRKGKAD